MKNWRERKIIANAEFALMVPGKSGHGVRVMGKIAKLLGGLVAVIVIVLGICVVRALPYAPTQEKTKTTGLSVIKVNPQDAAGHLAEAVRFKTVSHQDIALDDPAVFTAFQDWLRQTYPDFYGQVKTETVGKASQLNVWEGSDPALKHLVLLAHQDVVPADEGVNSGWQQPPFAGVIKDGFVWGRGSIDDKGCLVGLLEAANRLAKSGFKPKRTIIFAFGHDEEVGGTGAHAMAELLKKRGVKAWAVIDEGGAITTGMPDIKGPVARVGVAEKGYVTLKLQTKAEGGHSSTPPPTTAIGELAKAVAAVESHPFTHMLDPVLVQMLHHSARSDEMGFVKRVVLTNLWLFGPMVEAQMQKSEVGSAMLGTTIAPTIIHAGIKENALPREAEALVNFRINARDNSQSVLAHVRKAINDPDVEVSINGGMAMEPSPISQIGAGPYTWLEGVVNDAFPNTIVAPNIVIGGTDSRYYATITNDIYRFAPFTFDASDLHRIHGLNERMGVQDFAHGIQVYAMLMKQASEMKDAS